MFLLVALEVVVLTHLFLIGVVMMALAAAWGVVLFMTRPRHDAADATVWHLPAPAGRHDQDADTGTDHDANTVHETAQYAGREAGHRIAS